MIIYYYVPRSSSENETAIRMIRYDLLIFFSGSLHTHLWRSSDGRGGAHDTVFNEFARPECAIYAQCHIVGRPKKFPLVVRGSENAGPGNRCDFIAFGKRSDFGYAFPRGARVHRRLNI